MAMADDNTDLDKQKFHKLIILASQPLTSAQGKQRRDDNYNDIQTRLHKAEDTSEKPNDKSHPKNASVDLKNPQ